MNIRGLLSGINSRTPNATVEIPVSNAPALSNRRMPIREIYHYWYRFHSDWYRVSCGLFRFRLGSNPTVREKHYISLISVINQVNINFGASWVSQRGPREMLGYLYAWWTWMNNWVHWHVQCATVYMNNWVYWQFSVLLFRWKTECIGTFSVLWPRWATLWHVHCQNLCPMEVALLSQ